jgi:hypothetical protein
MKLDISASSAAPAAKFASIFLTSRRKNQALTQRGLFSRAVTKN